MKWWTDDEVVGVEVELQLPSSAEAGKVVDRRQHEELVHVDLDGDGDGELLTLIDPGEVDVDTADVVVHG